MFFLLLLTVHLIKQKYGNKATCWLLLGRKSPYFKGFYKRKAQSLILKTFLPMWILAPNHPLGLKVTWQRTLDSFQGCGNSLYLKTMTLKGDYKLKVQIYSWIMGQLPKAASKECLTWWTWTSQSHPQRSVQTWDMLTYIGHMWMATPLCHLTLLSSSKG